MVDVERSRLRDVATARALRWLVWGAVALPLPACVKDPERTRLADGSYHLVCQRELARCLEPMAEICKEFGYDVAEASERRVRTGPSGWEDKTTISEAVVRCRREKSLFGSSAPATAASSAVVAVVPTAVSPPRCVPGTSVACAGPHACVGAQVCGADGTFLACDCDPAAPTPVAADAQSPDSP